MSEANDIVIEEIEKVFPDYYPKSIIEQIFSIKAKGIDREVYRICKTGNIEKRSFLETCEEVKVGLRPPKDTDDPNSCGYYSMSTFIEYKDAKFVAKMLRKYFPDQIIIRGTLKSDMGVNIITREYNEKETSSHVDFWGYKNCLPHTWFMSDSKEVS